MALVGEGEHSCGASCSSFPWDPSLGLGKFSHRSTLLTYLCVAVVTTRQLACTIHAQWFIALIAATVLPLTSPFRNISPPPRYLSNKVLLNAQTSDFSMWNKLLLILKGTS